MAEKKEMNVEEMENVAGGTEVREDLLKTGIKVANEILRDKKDNSTVEVPKEEVENTHDAKMIIW